MSANTITGLIATMYKAYNQVARELVGGVTSVRRNTDVTGAAVGQTIRYPVVAPFSAATDIAPAAYPADATGRTTEYRDMTIEYAKQVSFPFTGEEELALQNSGNYQAVLQDTFAEAFRFLANTVESYLLTKAYKMASRAVGVAGTTPFASTTDVIAEARKILADNGAPLVNMRAVINTAAGLNIRKLDLFKKANESGDSGYRTGLIGNIDGVQIIESAQVPTHTIGTGTGYLVNNGSNEAAGQTTITVDTGSGTFVAGDVIKNSETGRDANYYVVKTGAAAAGDIVIANPGLLKQWTNNDAIAIQAAYAANLLFDANSIHLITRPPAMPSGGDVAEMVQNIVDPVTGLAFQVCWYKQYRQQRIEVAIAYGADVVKPENVAIIMG